MKKNSISLFLLITLLIAIPIFTINYSNNSSNLSQIEKNEKWEFLIDRVSKGHIVNNIEIFKGPIVYKLENASKQDSLAFKEVIEELKTILPNKEIKAYSEFTEDKNFEVNINNVISYNYLEQHTINLYFNMMSVGGNVNQATFNNYYFQTSIDETRYFGFLEPKIYFGVFGTDTKFKDRKRFIKYAFYKKLTTVSNIYNSNELDSENDIIKNSFFATNEFKPGKAEFSKYDQFFLQKIYSEDLIKELSNYLYKTYSWRYATNILDRNKALIIAKLLTIVLSVILFILAFRLLYKKKYKYKYLEYFIPLTIIAICATSLQNFYFYTAFSNFSMQLIPYLTSLLAYSLLAIVLSFILYYLDKVFIRETNNFIFTLILKVSFVILLGSISVYLYNLTNNQKTYLLNISSYEPYINFVLILAIGRGLLVYLNHFSDSIVKQKDIELSQLKQVNAEVAVELLQSKINPHFLYNALNSIASLAHTNADKTEKMALSLSDLFKYTINRKNKNISTLKDELEMVQNYLEIEQIRFGNRLEFTFNVDESLLNEEIPRFLIQPLIENAVKHGVSKKEGKGIIKLNIQKIETGFEISILDNGPNFTEGLISGLGLKTVSDLLRLTYGNKASLKWQNTPEKSITISIENNF